MSNPNWPAGPPSAPQGTGPAWAPPPSPRPRMLDALLVGTAAAALAGLAWWGVVSATKTQFVYGAVVVGFLVGSGVLIGARRGGAGPAFLALILTLTCLIVAEYFVQRTLAVKETGADIPLWLGLTTARDVVKESVTEHPMTGIFWLVALIPAVTTTLTPSRRPSL